MTPTFHKIDRKTFKGITLGLHFTIFVNVVQKLRQRVEVMSKLVKRVFQYFCFPDRLIKVGTSWISRKGEIVEKDGGVDLEREGEGGV